MNNETMKGGIIIIVISFATVVSTIEIDNLPDWVHLAQPRQVHLALHEDADSMRVDWVTFSPVTNSTPMVRYGQQQNTMDNVELGSTHIHRFGDITRYYHSAVMKHLAPLTTYYYQVGSDLGWTETYSFRTFDYSDSYKLKICVFGDLGVRNGQAVPTLQKRVYENAFDLLIHVGDIAYDVFTDSGRRGDEYMEMIEPIATKVPYMTIAGNHEWNTATKSFARYGYMFHMLNYPENNIPLLGNQYYSFEAGPIHFIGLSTELYGFYYDMGFKQSIDQFLWLKKDLEAVDRNKTPWIVAYMHRPFYCSNINSYQCHAFENRLVRVGYFDMPGMEALLKKYKVDLIFAGHEHSYERSWPVFNYTVYMPNNDEPNPYRNAKAPVHVITGSAGCHTPHAAFKDPPVPSSAVRSLDYSYTLLQVLNRSTLQIDQVPIDPPSHSHLVDQFWMSKDGIRENMATISILSSKLLIFVFTVFAKSLLNSY
ncbi:hypothetical protein AB6A40_003014 [Gnathostoma spinigerum]|uniref:Purple acid phosphatase n=1 Tax=Gnathostoma spinigerum TaxID=75299 RepID=A0ABD6EJ39_9BILA